MLRLISDMIGGLVVSADNPLDFHDETILVLPITLKYRVVGWNTK